ncbi:hypothetical protein KSC_083230 [Ktedonobacter sp. SOSP1-52]|nr:hypothetical protein KSC_083230 [Ktedonobacter sp. SOSP1-52]
MGGGVERGVLGSEGGRGGRDVEHELEGEGGFTGAGVAAEEGQADGEEVLDDPGFVRGKEDREIGEGGEGHVGAGKEF